MKERPVQHFTTEYLERCKNLTPDELLEFLEDFQNLQATATEKCQMISLKIEPSLLRAFKMKAKLAGIAYQTQIKSLMRQWLES